MNSLGGIFSIVQHHGRQPHNRAIARCRRVLTARKWVTILFKTVQCRRNRVADVETVPRTTKVALAILPHIPLHLVSSIKALLLQQATTP